MTKFIIKRIILLPVMLLCVALLVFILLNMSDSDPVLTALPTEFTQEQYDAKKAEMGLDKPLIVQYANWVKNAVTGDFGTSYKSNGPVIDEVGFRIPISLTLSFLTTAIMIIVGLPLGILCSVKQYRAFDTVVNILAKIAGAIPGFWLGIMLMMKLGLEMKIFPIYGLDDGWKSWVLPVTALVLPYIANYIRQVRSAMLDCIRQDYIRTARSKGEKEPRVILHEALKNALLPIITMSGSVFANLLGASVVIEKLFAIPGIGLKIVDSINARDVPTLLVCAMILATFTILMNLIIDLLYAVVDPRIRSTFASSSKKRRKMQVRKEVA